MPYTVVSLDHLTIGRQIGPSQASSSLRHFTGITVLGSTNLLLHITYLTCLPTYPGSKRTPDRRPFVALSYPSQKLQRRCLHASTRSRPLMRNLAPKLRLSTPPWRISTNHLPLVLSSTFLRFSLSILHLSSIQLAATLTLVTIQILLCPLK